MIVRRLRSRHTNPPRPARSSRQWRLPYLLASTSVLFEVTKGGPQKRDQLMPVQIDHVDFDQAC